MGVELHPYQRAGVDGVFSEFNAGRPAALVVMPTGTGKTYVGVAAAERVAREGGRRTLILAYRGELLDQWAEACDAFGLAWEVEKADQRALHRSLHDSRVDVVLGSINTMKGERLARWPEDHFGLVIYDEAHHGVAPSSLRIFEHFPGALRLGLTATPERGDGEDIQRVFGNCAFEYPFWRAVDEGWLVPPYFETVATHVDLSKIDAGKDDLAEGALDEEIARHVEEIVNGCKPLMGDRVTMGFTPRTRSAVLMADGFRQVGIGARSVHGKSQDRDTVVGQFKAGDYQCLCSCAMLLEGFDCKQVSCLAMARPTKSPIVFRQMLGRGLRTHEGKTHCLIIDLACNPGKHDLFRPIDLFDTTGMDLDILNIAHGILQSGKEQDPRRALREAERIHRIEVAAAIRVKERESRYHFVAFDPFAIGSLLGVPRRHVAVNAKPAQPHQIRRLQHLKLEVPEGYTRVEAKRLLDELDRRRREDLATHRQVAALVAQGVPAEQARALDFDAASGDLDILLGSRRGA
jgi:superfamily II DNA or RNA helicase